MKRLVKNSNTKSFNITKTELENELAAQYNSDNVDAVIELALVYGIFEQLDDENFLSSFESEYVLSKLHDLGLI